eukprot:11822-Pelagococcus_subviridis.AAC.1
MTARRTRETLNQVVARLVNITLRVRASRRSRPPAPSLYRPRSQRRERADARARLERAPLVRRDAGRVD